MRKLGAGAQATAADQTSETARFVYDEQGRLVGEYDNAGKLIQETVWMNDLPIATLRPKGANATLPLGTAGTGAATANNLGTNTAANKVNVDFFYVHPDHLGTSRTVSKPADNKRVWEWNSTPFGETAPNENPHNVAGAANQFRYNLRFPGQFYDAETGKHYNYFRDYDASLGRYLESDPIGLLRPPFNEASEINTYLYGMANPVDRTDVTGESSIIIRIGAGAMAACMKIPACKKKVDEAAKKCKDIECKFDRHPPHEKFPGLGYCEHYNLVCYEKGKGQIFRQQWPLPGRCYDTRPEGPYKPNL